MVARLALGQRAAGAQASPRARAGAVGPGVLQGAAASVARQSARPGRRGGWRQRRPAEGSRPVSSHDETAEPLRTRAEQHAANQGSRANALGFLAERVEAVVREHGPAVALVDGARRITYAELLARGDRLAAELQARGIGANDLVGVALPRSAELVIAIAGIVRAGAAYLPIDLAQPAERRALILSDARPRVVVTDGSRIDGIPPGSEVLPLPHETSHALPARPRPAPGDLAYVIYTSGSTGKPNGVRVTQRNVARLFTVCEPLYGFGPEDVWSLFHSIAFDFSVWELWGALLHGGRLVIVPDKTAKESDAFHALVLRERVTVLNQTPSAFRAFDMADAAAGRPASSLRHVIFGGEALDPRTLRAWFEAHGEKRPRLVNMYGITETTVHVTYRPILARDARGTGRSLIGSPLPDLRIELLGPDGQPVGKGEVGEICVGGEGVSDGYLMRPQLTAERFRPDSRGGHPDARLYHSGDLARRLPDGDLEYLGRADLQVKLRGFRIELGEIEALLRGVAGVRDAVVALREDPVAGPRLVAYIVQETGAAFDANTLRAQRGAAGRRGNGSRGARTGRWSAALHAAAIRALAGAQAARGCGCVQRADRTACRSTPGARARAARAGAPCRAARAPSRTPRRAGGRTVLRLRPCTRRGRARGAGYDRARPAGGVASALRP